ncbi:MAG: 1-acyl-sn-glycerol-3-phosphate acyltransferase [Deltaproteobacteria bacterium]|nr:1-acyl-sn-glycerol-3-phosphate acyltransferase [Deltaproteobacteria bacterium]
MLHLRPQARRRPDGAEGEAPREGGAEKATDAVAKAVGDGATTADAASSPPVDGATRAREAKASRPKRRAPRVTRDPAADPFTERLRALEREIDEVLAGVGPSAERGVVTVTRDAAEELLAFYADLARAFRRGGVGEVIIRLRMIGTADHVDDFGYDAAFAARVAPVLEFLYDQWWRVELSGAEHVPTKGRVLLVGNHSGGFFPYDGLIMAHGLRTRHGREVRPLIEDFAYHFPGIGPLLARLGAVRASAENAARLLAREHAIAVFPEGAKGVGKYYRERYRLQRFARGGFVTLALRTGAPLVPVTIIGGEEIHPVIAKWQGLARILRVPYFPVTPTFPWLGLLGLVPLPTKWRIVFGAPLDLAAEHGRDAADDDLLVNRLKERVREHIQRMIVEALRTRDSVFAG